MEIFSYRWDMGGETHEYMQIPAAEESKPARADENTDCNKTKCFTSDFSSSGNAPII